MTTTSTPLVRVSKSLVNQLIEVKDDAPGTPRAVSCARIAGVTVIVAELEKRINPLVDLSGMKLPVQVERLAVRREGIILDGMAEWDPASAPAKERSRRPAAARRDDGARREDRSRDRDEPPTRPAPPDRRDDRDAEFRRN